MLALTARLHTQVVPNRASSLYNLIYLFRSDIIDQDDMIYYSSANACDTID